MSIRAEYEKYGVKEYYTNHRKTYRNYHEKEVNELLLRILNIINKQDNILDLCCGNGLVTKILMKNGYDNIIGCDPYMYQEYKIETNKKCLKYNFIDIINYKLNIKNNIVICSFGLHLCEKYNLKMLINALKYNGMEILIIITPHKQPKLDGIIELKYEIYEFTHKNKKIYMRIYE